MFHGFSNSGRHHRRIDLIDFIDISRCSLYLFGRTTFGRCKSRHGFQAVFSLQKRNWTIHNTPNVPFLHANSLRAFPRTPKFPNSRPSRPRVCGSATCSCTAPTAPTTVTPSTRRPWRRPRWPRSNASMPTGRNKPWTRRKPEIRKYYKNLQGIKMYSDVQEGILRDSAGFWEFPDMEKMVYMVWMAGCELWMRSIVCELFVIMLSCSPCSLVQSTWKIYFVSSHLPCFLHKEAPSQFSVLTDSLQDWGKSHSFHLIAWPR